jgi:deferrochelatase/peroxidase EfeB
MPRRVPIAERGPGRSYRPDDRPPSIFAAHQPGIATPQPAHLTFAAFDVTVDGGEALRELLATWSAQAERLMRSVACGLTLTLGLGPGIFAQRFGLAPARPVALRKLPAFTGDALEAALCDGDVCIQACASERQAAADAVSIMAAAAGGGAVTRWREHGFLGPRPDGKPGANARDLLGFKSGTSNLRRGRELDRLVWVGRGERTWMLGGTFLVVRRIRVALDAWQALPTAAQERVIGRRRATGAPLGARREYDPLPLGAHEAGEPLIPRDAHARLAAPQSNAGAAMLRRSYSYDRGTDPDTGVQDAGLLFLAYQRDPQRQFVPVQARLADRDALARFTDHVGSAVFAIPPGARRGEFLAEPLLRR